MKNRITNFRAGLVIVCLIFFSMVSVAQQQDINAINSSNNINIFNSNDTAILINNTHCLAVSGTNMGAKLIAEDCADTETHGFVLDNNKIKLKGDSNKCLTYDVNAELGAVVYVWPCGKDTDNTVSQDFIIGSVIKLLSNIGQCLQMDSNTNKVITAKCDSANIAQEVSKQVTISVNGKCLNFDDIKIGSLATVKNCNASNKQKFYIIENFIKPGLDVNKCLDTFDAKADYSNLAYVDKFDLYLSECDEQNYHQKYLYANNKLIKDKSKLHCLTAQQSSSNNLIYGIFKLCNK